MSTLRAPYYHKKEGGDAYHWETSCGLNHYPAKGWVKSYTRPSGREQCNQCKTKWIPETELSHPSRDSERA